MGQAHETTVYAADDSAFSTNKIALGVMETDIGGDLVYAMSTGKRGTRQPYKCRSRIVSETVSRGFTMKPTADELDWILERMFGDNISGYPAGAAVPGETVPAFYLWVNKAGVQTFRYNTVRFDTISLSASEQQELILAAGLVGVDEEQVTDLSSGLPSHDCDIQFILPDITLTIGGTEFKIKSFNFTFTNNFGNGQFENSIKRQIFEAGNIAASLSINTGYRTANHALYRRGIAGDDGATLVMDNGTDTYTITMGNIKAPDGSPAIPEEGDVVSNLNFVITRTEAAPILSIAKS